MFILSFLAKAFMVLLMIAAVFGMVGFFVIMAKGPKKGSGDSNYNNRTPWG